jgi:integrase
MLKIDNIEFNSVLASSIVTLISSKHEEGKTYKQGIRNLLEFDKYCIKQNLSKSILTETFINKWLKDNGGRGKINNNYYLIVKGFSRYLNSYNSESYLISYDSRTYFRASVLASTISDFIISKRNEGFSYKSEEMVLNTIDCYCIKRNIKSLKGITCDFFEQWYSQSTYSKNYHYLARELSIYMKTQNGFDIEIPDQLIKKGTPKENYEYVSVFKNLLRDFVEEKKQCGYKYDSEKKILKYFDLLCIEMDTKIPELTKEIVVRWSVQKNTENKGYTNKRISIIRQFAKYLISYNLKAYIAPNRAFVKVVPPHIFKEEELLDFFECADRYVTKKPYIKLTLPVIFRFYYCLGLRLNEAINIKRDDIDFHSGKILIRMAKNLKDRFVYMPNDLLMLAKMYDERIRTTVPDREYFFTTDILGTKFNGTSLCGMFTNIWNATKYAESVDKKPTIHSFRHSMVVKRLEEWYQKEVNYNERLPYLSAFLGHEKIESTFYYVHLVESAFSIIRAKMAQFEDLYPEDKK